MDNKFVVHLLVQGEYEHDSWPESGFVWLRLTAFAASNAPPLHLVLLEDLIEEDDLAEGEQGDGRGELAIPGGRRGGRHGGIALRTPVLVLVRHTLMAYGGLMRAIEGSGAANRLQERAGDVGSGGLGRAGIQTGAVGVPFNGPANLRRFIGFAV